MIALPLREPRRLRASQRRARRRSARRAVRDSARRYPPAPRQRASRSTAMTRCGAFEEQRARRARPGPGPTSTTVRPASGPAARAMRRVRLRSRMKFCPRLFLAREPELADHLAQAAAARRDWRRTRRRASPGAHAEAAAARAAAMAAASFRALDEARRRGAALGRNVEGRAVVGRGAHERQPQGDVDAFVEGDRLQRDQRLVVIHGDHRVVGARALRGGTACRRDAGR